MIQTTYQGHYSVLLDETVELLNLNATTAATVIDCTLGEAGHSLAILERYPLVKIVGVDADMAMIKTAKNRLTAYQERVLIFNSWFDDFLLNYPANLAQPQAILMDLGVAMFHFMVAQRGFSYHDDQELDMRLGNGQLTAHEVVNTYDAEELADILWRYGEERLSRKIAQSIIAKRKAKALTSAKELSTTIYNTVMGEHTQKIQSVTRCFQAIRIEVNNELGRLERGLDAAFKRLKVGGRLAVISFHSLEDRMVKTFFAEKSKPCQCPPNVMICQCQGAYAKIINKGGSTASSQELSENNASRSARLRVIEKLRAEG